MLAVQVLPKIKNLLYFIRLRVFIFVMSFFFVGCPVSYGDVIMFQLYHAFHEKIWQASHGTLIPEAYLAALISLETSPPGNWESKRFEKHIYKRLKELKYSGKTFGSISRKAVKRRNDGELRQLATSYGPTQLMGYHCLQIGCTIKELSGKYHLQWAIIWMEKQYGKYARRGHWESCFRIHNTGRPDGKTYHKGYVKRGLKRMRYYEKWMIRNGRLF